MGNGILKKVTITLVNEKQIPVVERIVRETALDVFVNGHHFATAMILASREKEFIVGHLYVQGLIHEAADIVSMEIENDVARVELRPGLEKRQAPEKIVSNLRVSGEDILECVQSILKSPVFEETEAVHSAGLFLDGRKTVAIAEDLGRHNALDKVIGEALLNNIAFSRTVATSTGRQPAEMILKCLSAGIPIIATKGVPTSQGLELAEKTGITIVGLVRRDTMIVYSHGERVE